MQEGGTFPLSPGEICAFGVHGSDAPFEAVVLNRTSGEGQLRTRSPIDCERQREYTFTIQAHDCGSGPGGIGAKKSHKKELDLMQYRCQGRVRGLRHTAGYIFALGATLKPYKL
ncbi:calsyntenin-2 [Tachysurus ichikawai]